MDHFGMYYIGRLMDIDNSRSNSGFCTELNLITEDGTEVIYFRSNYYKIWRKAIFKSEDKTSSENVEDLFLSLIKAVSLTDTFLNLDDDEYVDRNFLMTLMMCSSDDLDALLKSGNISQPISIYEGDSTNLWHVGKLRKSLGIEEEEEEEEVEEEEY